MPRNSLYKRLYLWRLSHISEQTYLLFLSVLVGLLSGLAAVLLKTVVHLSGQYVMTFGNTHFTLNGGNVLIFAAPLVGILLTVVFVRYIIKGNIGHGIPSVLLAISRKKGVLPPRNMYSSLVASTLTVAFGGSVGLEAPIASTGSAIGSNVGRFFHVSSRGVKLLLGCGAAGAIAGIFKAPLAGVLFTVEVLMFDMTMTTAVPLLISALSAATVAYFLMGQEVQFAFHVTEDFTLGQIPFLIVLGIFCALSSIYFLRCTDRVEGWFARSRKWIVKWAVGGLTLGIMIFLFPPLFGEGYSSLTELFNGNSDALFSNSVFAPWRQLPWATPALLLVLLLLKPVATATTIGSGDVGGTFGPSLVMGGLSGYLIAATSNLMGLPPQSAANFALVGMAAVMTGVMHAPFMGVFLIAEITGGYALMAPLLITATVTYICVQPFEKHSIYARKLAKKGDLLTHNKDASAWQLMDLNKLIETNFTPVHPEGHLRDVVEAIKHSKRNLFPVVDDQGKFLGLIVMDDIRQQMFDTTLYDTLTIRELMQTFPDSALVHSGESLAEAVKRFKLSNRYNLIVVDDAGHYIGFLSRANTFSAYRRFVLESSEE